MDQLTINTTQNVKVSFTQAPLAKRIVASLLDTIFMIIYMIGGLGVWNYLGLSDYMSDGVDLFILLFFMGIPVIFYSLWSEFFLNGSSLGKKIMKLRVIKIDGYHATFADYLVRWIFRSIDVMIGSGAIAVISVVYTKKGQRLGDLAASTAVVSVKSVVLFGATIYEELDHAYEPQYKQVMKLSDHDIRLIKDVLADFKSSRNQQLLIALVEKVESIIGVKSKESSHVVFIETVLKDYNYLNQQEA